MLALAGAFLWEGEALMALFLIVCALTSFTPFTVLCLLVVITFHCVWVSVLLISFAFLLLFMAFESVTKLQSSINAVG